MDAQNPFRQNPFRVLGASTTDDLHRLIELSTEASLLGERDTEQALAALMNSNQRLDAEMNWFPRLSAGEADALLRFPRTEREPFPSLDAMTPLARLNACRVLLDHWPVIDEESAAALCLSFASAERAVHAPEVAAQLNEDRAAAGVQLLSGPQAVADRISALRSQIVSDLFARLKKTPGLRVQAVIVACAQRYAQYRSQLIDALVDRHTLSRSDEIRRRREEIEALCGQVLADCGSAKRIELCRQIDVALKAWGEATCAQRHLEAAKGLQTPESDDLCRMVLNLSVDLNNSLGLRSSSVTLTQRMIDVFFNLPKHQPLLRSNLHIMTGVRS